MERDNTQAANGRQGLGEVSADARPGSGRSGRRSRPWLRFTQHLVEMLLAMGLGMALLVPVLSVVGLPPGYLTHPLVQYAVMAVAMVAPMVLWMRVRGHSWTEGAQMSLAMVVPMFAVVTPVELGVAALSAGSLMVVTHVVMIAGMVGWMVHRWDVYAHGSHRR